MKNLQFIGIDDGHSSIKATSENKNFTMKSKVHYGEKKGFNILTGEDDNSIYSINNLKYTVSKENIDNTLETRLDDFSISDINIVLVHHSLQQIEASGDISICTGLPFNRYYHNSETNNKLITQKTNVFNVDIKSNKKINYNIVSHMVCSQGVAVYFDLLLNNDGSCNTEMQDEFGDESVIIIDIGGGTTDIVAFKNNNIQFDLSTTLDIGCLSVEDKLYQTVTCKLNSYKIPKVITQNIIENNGIYKGTKTTHDFSEDFKSIKLELAGTIINKIKQMISNTLDISIIAFAGGGSILLHDELKHLFPSDIIKFVKDPIYSNSRGMRKLLLNGE